MSAYTPESVVEHLHAKVWGEFGECDFPTVERSGSVLHVEIRGQHFEAHVFAVEPTPPVAAEPVELDPKLARELADCNPGRTWQGWTIVENEQHDSTRWESHHGIVIRNEAGEHFHATYSQGLTEYQDTKPWEYEKAVFEPVERRTRVIQTAEWVTPKAVEDAAQESVPQPCLLHEGDAHNVDECRGEG